MQTVNMQCDPKSVFFNLTDLPKPPHHQSDHIANIFCLFLLLISMSLNQKLKELFETGTTLRMSLYDFPDFLIRIAINFSLYFMNTIIE